MCPSWYRGGVFLPLAILIFLVSFQVLAGGPLSVSTDGEGSAWDNSAAISYHPESGTCADFSNASMLTKIATDLAAWTGLTEVDLSFSAVTGSLPEVNGDNYKTYLYIDETSSSTLLSDEINPVIFDDDAEITAAIAGEGNKYLILGFAGAVGFSADKAEVIAGQAVLNCRCLDGHNSGVCLVNGSTITVSEEELDFTIIHEMGHFLNLDHSQVNISKYNNGVDTDDADLPIMFPVSFETSAGLTPREDDKVSLGSLYPATTFTSTHCLVSGTLLDKDGNELMCADVWAENGDSSDTVSFVSGSVAVATDKNDDGDVVDSGECTSQCGYFEVFLKPGSDYTVTVKEIDSAFTGGSGVGPCLNGQKTTIKEEAIATVSTAQCTGGSTISLGSITTASSGGTSSSGSASSGGGSSIGLDDLNPVGYWCALISSNSNDGRSGSHMFFVALTFALMFLWRVQCQDTKCRDKA